MLQEPSPLSIIASGVHAFIAPARYMPSAATVMLSVNTVKVTSSVGKDVPHAVQDAKQTTSNVASAVPTVYPRFPFTAHATGTLSSRPQLGPLMNLYSTAVPSAIIAVYSHTSSPSASVIAVAPALQPWKLPAMNTPMGLVVCSLMSTWNVTACCTSTHASQLFQHTGSNVWLVYAAKERLVKPSMVDVHDSPPANSSCAVHPSTVNLYSMVSGATVTVMS